MTSVYHDPTTASVTPTNPAWVLSPTAQRVYDVLCYTIPVGVPTHISHADIAALGHLSEGTVSRVMPELVEHGFIDRERMPGGRGGGYYLITLLRLPPGFSTEGFTVDGISDGSDRPCMGSAMDDKELPTVTPQADDLPPASQKDQFSILSRCTKDHDMIHDSAAADRAREAFSDDQETLLRRLLQEPNMNPHLARNVTRNLVGSLADFEADVTMVSHWPHVDRPFWFVVSCWRDGQRVNPRSTEEHHAEPPTRSDARGGAPRAGHVHAHQSRRSARAEGRPTAPAIDYVPANFGMEWLVPANAPSSSLPGV